MQAANATAEAEARATLRAVVAAGEIERSIAEQSWEPVPGDRRVRETFRCRRVRLDRVAGGVRIITAVRGGEPAEWTVPNPPERRTRT